MNVDFPRCRKSPPHIRLRRGFTLVELLVVIAIIGVLVALLLPAVQMAREAARRSQCSNNLKQLALACHNYADANKQLPMGAMAAERDTYTVYTNQQCVGFTTLVLPYIEQSALYDGVSQTIDLSPNSNDSYYWGGGTSAPIRQFANARIESLLCPSDDAYANTLRTHTCLSVGSASATSATVAGYAVGVTGGDELIGRTNYTGVAGRLGAADPTFEGIMVSRTKRRFADITDGTSNTMMIGEATGHFENTDSYSLAWMGAGTMPTAWGLNAAGPSWYRFGSRHPGIVQFAYADGSVHSIPETIDFNTYIYLSAMGDGKVVSEY